MSLSLIGVLPVSGLNIGVQAALPVIQARITSLEELIAKLTASLEAQAEVSINIPSLQAVLDGIAESVVLSVVSTDCSGNTAGCIRDLCPMDDEGDDSDAGDHTYDSLDAPADQTGDGRADLLSRRR